MEPDGHFKPGPKPVAHRTANGRLLAGVWYKKRRYAMVRLPGVGDDDDDDDLDVSDDCYYWIDDNGDRVSEEMTNILWPHWVQRSLPKLFYRYR
jgi:hypothetical protein